MAYNGASQNNMIPGAFGSGYEDYSLHSEDNVSSSYPQEKPRDGPSYPQGASVGMRQEFAREYTTFFFRGRRKH